MSAEVKEHVDLIRTNALRLLLDGEIREHIVIDLTAQTLGKVVRTIIQSVRIDIIFLPKPAQESLIEHRG